MGKSTLCEKLAALTGLRWIEVSKVAKENNCLEEYDEEYQCPVLDEDKVRKCSASTSGALLFNSF